MDKLRGMGRSGFNGITGLAIRRPITMLMIVGVLVLAGIVSYQRLPVQQLPNVSFAFVVVTVRYPGANPNDVLQTVTAPVENAVSTVSGIQSMSGLSSDGLSRVSIQFAPGTDVNAAANEIAQVVNRIQGQLPTGTQTPTITKANPNASPIMTLVLSGNVEPAVLYNLASNTIQPALQQVPGVAAVDVQGGQIPQVNVTVKPGALESYGVTIDQVTRAIGAQNVSIPGGNTTVDGQTRSVRTQAYFQSTDDLENLVILSRPEGPVTLRKVADVSQGFAPVTQIAKLNGENAIGMSITSQSGANIVEVSDAVKASLARLRRGLPAGIQTTVVNDQTVYTNESIRAVQDDLVLAVLLPAIVLLLFLHRFRNTVIVLLAIPTSLISSFTVMYFVGFSLDLISLLALSLITGILVDDSIVVLENINRHLAMGKSPMQAAFDGRKEIGLAAVAITLTDVVVFAPIAFTSGLVGQLFKEFGLTIVAATLFSLFISFTLTPLLASRWLSEAVTEESLAHSKSRNPWTRFGALWERGYGKIQRGYGRAIGWALRRRILIVLMGVVALGLSLSFLPLGWLQTEFAPQEDNGQFSVNIQLPVGTPLTQTAQTVDQLATQIRQIPGVVRTYSTAGSRGGFFGGGNTNGGSVQVDLLPVGQRPPIDDYLNQVRALGRRFPNASVITQVASSLRVGGQRSIQVQVQGPDLSVVTDLAAQAGQILRDVPGVVDVRSEASQPLPEFAVELNRERAASLGITAQTVGQTVQAAIAGSTASQLRSIGSTNQTPIVVNISGNTNLTAQQIEQLPISTANSTRVRLGQVAKVVPATGPAQINDQNRQLQISVSASTTPGAALGQVSQDIERTLRSRLTLPPGYNFNLGGATQQQRDVFGPLQGAFFVAILLVYMLTSALYESLLYPLAVLLSLPLATVGAFTGLVLSGNTLNIFSFMGLIMLMGLVAKNAILLVDFTNTLRGRGLGRTEALMEAGRERLRPIIMTTCTMVFAMLPLAIKFGAGAEQRSPMATVLVSGLLSSTLLTLIFVPVVYTYLDDFGRLLARIKAAIFRARPPRPAAAPAPVPALTAALPGAEMD